VGVGRGCEAPPGIFRESFCVECGCGERWGTAAAADAQTRPLGRGSRLSWLRTCRGTLVAHFWKNPASDLKGSGVGWVRWLLGYCYCHSISVKNCHDEFCHDLVVNRGIGSYVCECRLRRI